VIDEMPRFLIVIIKLDMAGGHDLQLRCDATAEQAGVLRVEAFQQQPENPPVAYSVDTAPATPSAFFEKGAH
jgi:hypothetical protein